MKPLTYRKELEENWHEHRTEANIIRYALRAAMEDDLKHKYRIFSTRIESPEDAKKVIQQAQKIRPELYGDRGNIFEEITMRLQHLLYGRTFIPFPENKRQSLQEEIIIAEQPLPPAPQSYKETMEHFLFHPAIKDFDVLPRWAPSCANMSQVYLWTLARPDFVRIEPLLASLDNLVSTAPQRVWQTMREGLAGAVAAGTPDNTLVTLWVRLVLCIAFLEQSYLASLHQGPKRSFHDSALYTQQNCSRDLIQYMKKHLSFSTPHHTVTITELFSLQAFTTAHGELVHQCVAVQP